MVFYEWRFKGRFAKSAPSIALREQRSISSFSGAAFQEAFQKRAFKKSFQKELFKNRFAQRGRYQQVVMRELVKLHSVRRSVLRDEGEHGKAAAFDWSRIDYFLSLKHSKKWITGKRSLSCFAAWMVISARSPKSSESRYSIAQSEKWRSLISWL